MTAGITTDFEDHVLMIRDLQSGHRSRAHGRPLHSRTTTISADKSWTFKHLMTQMAAPTTMTPSDFTEKWLDNWLWTQTLNSLSGSQPPGPLQHLINSPGALPAAAAT